MSQAADKRLAITLFSSNETVLRVANAAYRLERVIVEKRAFSPRVFDFCQWHSIDFHLASSGKDILALDFSGDVGLCYGYGIIFRAEHIARFRNGIINIHPGKLPAYRGRHPLGWALIKGDKNIVVSAHQINEQIDQGRLLAESTIAVDFDDDEVSLSHKIDRVLEASLLEQAVHACIAQQGEELGVGEYLDSLVGQWDELNPDEHDANFVFNVFRSKRKYGGLTVNGVKFSDCTFILDAMESNYQDFKIFTCADGQRIGLK